MGDELANRAAIFAALGEPVRLAIVDRLAFGDLSPGELGQELRIATNLLAHHLKVLQRAGVIRRTRSEGDGRRSYVHLRVENDAVRAAARPAQSPDRLPASIGHVVFVCTANSARSQLAAATWNEVSPIPAASGGTHPARCVHARALKVARRHGIRLHGAVPTHLLDVLHGGPELVVAVCDIAHEELSRDMPRIHWSVPDPARQDTEASFERAYADIKARVRYLSAVGAVAQPPAPVRRFV